MANTGLINSESVVLESVVLEKLRVKFAQQLDPRIGASFRGDLELAYYRDYCADRMVAEVSSHVLAEKLVDKTVTKDAYHRVNVHASWWQHFKDEVLDRFWLTRWFVQWRPVRFDPVVYQETLTANFKQYATFPAADIRTPERVHHMLIAPYEVMSWS